MVLQTRKLTAQAGSSKAARLRLNCASAVVKRHTKTKRLESNILGPDKNVKKGNIEVAFPPKSGSLGIRV